MTAPPSRDSALDQFRGFTVLAMFVVNFVGGLKAVPATLLHHHTHLSFADAVMPAFLFCVGFGMRASFLGRAQRDGARRAYSHLARRCLALVLLGTVVYHLTGKYESWAALTAVPVGELLLHTIKRGPFEALTHIGVTSLWVLPVLARPGWVRVLFATSSGGLHVWASHAGYYQWNMSAPRGIDGGPLGFLTWVIPLVAGTLAHDWASTGRTAALGVLLVVGGSLLARWGSSDATWPFVAPASPPSPSYWVMSQRAGSVTYLLAGAGLAALGYTGFRLVPVRAGLLDLLGRHALAGYLIHDPVSATVRPFCPADAPGWWVAVCLGVYLGITVLFLRYLDRHRLWLKL